MWTATTPPPPPAPAPPQQQSRCPCGGSAAAQSLFLVPAPSGPVLESNPPRLLTSQIVLVTLPRAQRPRQAQLGHVVLVEAGYILAVGLRHALFRLAHRQVVAHAVRV